MSDFRRLPTPSTGTPTQTGFGNNSKFMRKFHSMLKQTGAAKRKNPVGTDMARGAGQVRAAINSRNKTKKTPTLGSVNPVSAAMQHSVRNRSTEQGGNASTKTGNAHRGSNSSMNVNRLYGINRNA